MELDEEDISLLDLLSRFWWLMLLRGLIVALYGVLTFISPDNAALASVSIFAIYMVLCGALALTMGLRAHRLAWRVSTFIIPGIICLIAATGAVVLPLLAMWGVLALGGLWSMMLGLMEILLASRLRKAFFHQLTLLTAGLVSAFLGVSMLMSPWKILMLDLWKIQVAALFLGTILSLLSFGMRHIKD